MQAGVATSVEHPQKVSKINVNGALNVLEAAQDSETERVIVASSSSVYGKPQYLPYDESHPMTPVSPYGASKLAAEQYIRVYYKVYGLPTVSLRYFTVYGPRMRPIMAISNFVSRCMNGEPPVVYSDGTQTRDFTYIGDFVQANTTLLTTDAADIEILELAKSVWDELAPPLDITYAERHDADAQHTHADISKAKEYIDYEPSIGIEFGLERFIEWYSNNRDLYEPLVRKS